ncbi:hypothetical protein ES708_05177 [subsurface metagenome]
MTLESMRRGFVGGSMLSLFIIKEFGLEGQAVPTLEWLRRYLDIEEELLSHIPFFLDFILAPFSDYHESAKLYLEIVDMLSELQQPRACDKYW